MSDYTLPPVPDALLWAGHCDIARAYGHACRAPLIEANASLSAANAALSARIAELEAENQTLTRECADAEDESGRLEEELQKEHDENARLRAEVEDWRKLLDPVNLHVNLLQGKPAQLTKAQLAHLLGQDYTALLSEVESLESLLDLYWKSMTEESRDKVRAKAGEWVNPLAAEVEKYKADAERYRWLRSEAFAGCPSPEGSSRKDAFLVIQGYGYSLEDKQVDDAVDGAIAARKGTEGDQLGEGSEG